MEIMEFLQKVIDNLNEMDEAYQGVAKVVTKNNGTIYHGIEYRKRIGKCTVTPCIYIDEDYKNGKDVESVAEKLFQMLQKKVRNMPFANFDRYEDIKDYIGYQVINFDWNKSLLEDWNLYFDQFLDLAKVYCLYLPMGDGTGIVKLNKQLIDKWVEEEDIDPLVDIVWRANENMYRKYTCEDLYGLLNLLMDPVMLENGLLEESKRPKNVKVLSKDNKQHGASVLCDKAYLDDVLGEEPNIILPSSIHEVIAFPYYNIDVVEELFDMVESVNSTTVEPEERLSNNIYLWNNRHLSVLTKKDIK